jgi:hypothetical protein
MSYMRGDYYLWRDEERVHVWARDGYDFWDESVWNGAQGDEGESEALPSGVAIPLGIADEFAVMRTAQLLTEGQLEEVVKRTIEKWNGNGGCIALAGVAERLAGLEPASLRAILDEFPAVEPDDHDRLSDTR